MKLRTRIMVTGRYLDSKTYQLVDSQGDIFQTIREGESFVIDNQQRFWNPVRVPRRSGYGTILMCQKFSDNGEVIEEFPLLNNKTGLWALTSGAARNGVFHNYVAPKNILEEALENKGVSKSIVEQVSSIDVELQLRSYYSGGQEYGIGSHYDGKTIYSEEEDFIEENFPEGTFLQKVRGGSYLIETDIHTFMGGARCEQPIKVYITEDADLNKVAEIISKL